MIKTIKFLKLIFLSMIIFFLSVYHCFGQDTLNNNDNVLSLTINNDSLQYKHLNITTTLTDYLLVSNINIYNINLGTEFYLKNQKSLSANFGLIKSYGPSGGSLFSISSLKTQGIKFQIEGRHYFKKFKLFEPAILLFWLHIFQYKSQMLQNSGYYIAIHSSYQFTMTDREGENYNQINNPEDIYTVNRYVYSLNAKLGYNCIKKYGLTLDYAIGLGVKYINSSSLNSGTNDSWPNNEKDIPWNILFNNGFGFYPNIIYQFKIGWAI